MLFRSPRGKPEPLIQIIGLVKNTKYYDLHEEFLPVGFYPASQAEEPSPSALFVEQWSAQNERLGERCDECQPM